MIYSIYKERNGKLYYCPSIRGAYYMALEYEGEKFTKWTVSTRIDIEAEKLIDLVIELWSLKDCEEVRDKLNEDLYWEFVERKDLPAEAERMLQNEESYLVEEVSYEY